MSDNQILINLCYVVKKHRQRAKQREKEKKDKRKESFYSLVLSSRNS